MSCSSTTFIEKTILDIKMLWRQKETNLQSFLRRYFNSQTLKNYGESWTFTCLVEKTVIDSIWLSFSEGMSLHRKINESKLCSVIMQETFLDSKVKRSRLATTSFSFPRRHVHSQLIKERNLYRIMVVYVFNVQNNSGFKMAEKATGNPSTILLKDNKEKEDIESHVRLCA